MKRCSASDAVMFSFMLQYNICQSHFGVAILQREPTTSIQEQGRIEPILSMAPEEAKSQPLVMVNVYTRGVLSGKSQDVRRCHKMSQDVGKAENKSQDLTRAVFLLHQLEAKAELAIR